MLPKKTLKDSSPANVLPVEPEYHPINIGHDMSALKTNTDFFLRMTAMPAFDTRLRSKSLTATVETAADNFDQSAFQPDRGVATSLGGRRCQTIAGFAFLELCSRTLQFVGNPLATATRADRRTVGKWDSGGAEDICRFPHGKSPGIADLPSNGAAFSGGPKGGGRGFITRINESVMHRRRSLPAHRYGDIY